MRLAYVTTILTPHDDGQSIQVQAMGRVFHEALQGDFLFVSPEYVRNRDLTTSFAWRRVRVLFTTPRFLRYILFLVGSWKYVSNFRPEWLYSRDIGVVFLYTLLGYRVTYEIHKPFETWIGSFLFRLLSRRIRCITISEALQQHIVSTYSIDHTNTLVARDGVFLEDFLEVDRGGARDALLREVSATPEAYIVMYSGNLYPGKGLEVILSLAEGLPDVTFVVIGLNTVPEGTQPAPKNVVFLGRKELGRIPHYLCGADLLILPFTRQWALYRWHSALKMFEYMASGIPIIASNVGATSEVFTDKNAYLFDPDHLEEAVATVRQIRDNKSHSLEKARQAFEQVGELTWQKRAQKILEFLNR